MAIGWDKNYPLSTTSVSGSPDEKRENFEIIEQWWSVGHSTFNTQNAGKHEKGKVPVLGIGTAQEIQGWTTATSGAIAYATDAGRLMKRTSSWVDMTSDYFSRVRKICGTQNIPSSIWTHVTSWQPSASGTYDTLGEWQTDSFAARESGFYIVSAGILWEVKYVACQTAVAVMVNDVVRTIIRRFASPRLTCDDTQDILYLNAKDVVKVAVWHNYSTALAISSGTIQIQRLS